MDIIKEISRRCEAAQGCGLEDMSKVIGEMVVEINGEKKYLTCVWISVAGDGLSMEISSVPILDYYMDDETFSDELEDVQCSDDYESYLVDINEAYTGDYEEQFSTLQKIVVERAKEEGFLEDWMYR